MKKIIRLLLWMIFVTHFIPVSATPMYTLDVENSIEGKVGIPLDGTIILTISDEAYEFNEDYLYEDVTDWFEKIPEGLSGEISQIEGNVAYIDISGTPTEKMDKHIIIKLPDDALIVEDEFVDGVSNLPDDKAKFIIGELDPRAQFDRPSTVSGYVNEDLELQYVYIKIIDTKPTFEMNGAILDIYNGLQGKVVEIDPENNVIKLEYSGIPFEEDHSLIEVVIAPELTESAKELIVPLREDVLFDIKVRKASAEPEPEKEKEVEKVIEKVVEVKTVVVYHPIPHTGIE